MADPALLVPYFRLTRQTYGPISAEVKIAKADNRRVTLIMTTQTTGGLFVDIKSGFDPGTDGRVLEKALPIELTFRNHPLLVNQEWYVNVVTISPGLYLVVTEVLYYPPVTSLERGE